MKRQPAPCVIEGCERLGNVPGSGFGMCRPHYQRHRESTAEPCSALGCENPSRARGLCKKHLSRVTRHGTLDLPSEDIEQRFWALVGEGPIPEWRPDLGPCWLWTGKISSRGYGRLDPQRGMHILCHRWSYEALIAPIPDGLTIDHLCRVKRCVNPWHMEPVPISINAKRGWDAYRQIKAARSAA
jgi:hypothetical protein